MIKFIDTHDELQEYITQLYKHDSINYVCPTDYQLHPSKDVVSFIWSKIGEVEWVLGFNHTDLIEFHFSDIYSSLISKSKVKRWVFDKKGTLQRLPLDNMYDIDSYSYFNGGLLDYNSYFDGLHQQYRRYGMREIMNSHVPIMKLVERIRTLAKGVGDITNVPTYFSWYNDIVIPTLSGLETSGLHVNTKIFFEHFKHVYMVEKHIHDNIVYTQYNPFTQTTRPSNHHGGVNYAALNKGDGTREAFTSRWERGNLLQFDFDAYHVRLIADMINYDLPDTSVHEYFANQYGCSYDEAKQRTFKNLYSGVSDEDAHISFFQKSEEFIQNIHQLSKYNDLTTPTGGIPIQFDSNPYKVFNYYLQAVETEQSILTIKDILETLEGYKTKLVLYTYDSFLFDYNFEDTIDLAKRLKEVIGKKWKVKATWGDNYSQL